MEPDQLPTPQQQGQQPINPYDFILNTAQPPKKTMMPNNSNKSTRIIVVAAGLGVLAAILVVSFSLLSKGGKGADEALVTIAAHQQEIIRITDTANKKATRSPAKNLAITTFYGLTTDQQNLLARIGKKAATDQKLNAQRSSKTDTLLKDAEKSNNFDAAFMEIIKAELVDYQLAVKERYSLTKNAKVKQLLADEYTHAGLLLLSLASN